MEKTALIILNYNNCRDTVNCLMSIDRYNSAPIKVIVVDNASRPEQREELMTKMRNLYGDKLSIIRPEVDVRSNHLADVNLVLNDVNSGYARGNNIGLELAYKDDQIDKVMILNNDVIFVEDFIPELIRRQESLLDCGLISPKLYKPGLEEPDINCARRNEPVSMMIRKNMLHYWWRYHGKYDSDMTQQQYMLDEIPSDANAVEIELPSGSCMLIDKKLMQEIGGFDPHTFLYYEENILYQKLKKVGRKNYLCPDLRCVHLGAATTSALPKSIGVMRAGVESQRYYVKEYSKATAVERWLYELSSRWFWLTFRLQKRLQRKS